MKKQIAIIFALILAISLCACGSSKEKDDTAPAESTTQSASPDEGKISQSDIEKMIVGKWIKSEIDGRPVLTDEKSVFDIVSTTEAYTSASHITDEGDPFDYNQKSIVDINGNVVTITTTTSEGESLIHELTITDISNSGFTANRKFTRTTKGTDPLLIEDTVYFVKVNDDYGSDIIGTWEGHCTSEGSVFDDGQEHRWEFKDDGTYVYYVKDGDNWVPSENTMNEYFVAGNLLCFRWIDSGTEDREWWDITIDGDTMKWTAVRSNEDGTPFTASFEMTRVKK